VIYYSHIIDIQLLYHLQCQDVWELSACRDDSYSLSHRLWNLQWEDSSHREIINHSIFCWHFSFKYINYYVYFRMKNWYVAPIILWHYLHVYLLLHYNYTDEELWSRWWLYGLVADYDDDLTYSNRSHYLKTIWMVLLAYTYKHYTSVKKNVRTNVSNCNRNLTCFYSSFNQIKWKWMTKYWNHPNRNIIFSAIIIYGTHVSLNKRPHTKCIIK
jgi:hypothetical protein